MRLILVPPIDLPDTLSIFYPKIEAATHYSVGKYKGGDIVRFLVSGAMQLWAACDEDKVMAIAITEMVVYPQRKICRFLCATGEHMQEWFNFIDDMETWAVANGCDGFQAECRPGWEKFLKPKGYAKSHIIVNKEIGACH